MDSSGNVTVVGAATVTLGPATTIDQKIFLQHKHKGVVTGSDDTGEVA